LIKRIVFYVLIEVIDPSQGHINPINRVVTNLIV